MSYLRKAKITKMLSRIIDQNDIDHFKKWLDRAERIVITTHTSPDGDAIGSSLGLWHYLRLQGKDVHVIIPNNFPDFLRWMNGTAEIVRYDKHKEQADQLIADADIICCLDYNEISRIDAVGEPVLASKAKKIMIDHHLHPSDFCGIVISHPEISSASELVFRFICRLGGFNEISFEAAECIYCGMMTDTGSFTYNSNNPEIYYIISELMSKGIDKDAIYRRVYNTYSEGRLRLQGYVLYCKMKLFQEYNAALITLSREEQKRFHYNKGDTEGLVNLPLSVKDIVFSAFLREDTEKKMIKISLRSTGSFPCNQIASEYFGGGGHLNASGGEFYGPLEEAENLFKQALVKYKALLNKK